MIQALRYQQTAQEKEYRHCDSGSIEKTAREKINGVRTAVAMGDDDQNGRSQADQEKVVAASIFQMLR